jgi:hypothetical protein
MTGRKANAPNRITAHKRVAYLPEDLTARDAHRKGGDETGHEAAAARVVPP